MKTLVPLLFLAIGLTATAPTSDAKPINFDFTAVVASVEHPVFPSINVGDLVIGQYVFESRTPDSDPGDPTRGLYLSGGRFDAKIGALNFSFPLSFIEVLHNYGGAIIDRYTVAAVNGNTLIELTLLDDVHPTAFKDDSLPLVPPPLTAFYSKQFQVFVRNPPNPDFIARINANVVTLVPEPGTLILVAFGLAMLAVTAIWSKGRRI